MSFRDLIAVNVRIILTSSSDLNIFRSV